MSVIVSQRSSTRSSWWLENSRFRPARTWLEDHLGQELHGGGIEAGEGLVEHEHVRLVDHGRGQLHPLGHAAGQVLDLVLAAVAEAEALEEVGGASLAGRLVEAVEAGDPREQVEHPHVAVEAALLRHVAPRAAVVVGGGPVAPRHGAGVGLRARRTGSASAWSCRRRWAPAAR